MEEQEQSNMNIGTQILKIRKEKGLTQEELSRLAAFFTVLGDLLALYALDAPEGRQNAPPTGP